MKKKKDIIEKSMATIEKLLDLLGVEADVECKISKYKDGEDNENEFVDINITGDELGVLIGYLGRNLRAFQKIAGMMINHEISDITDGDYVRVVIDVAGYREGRKDHLIKMAEQMREDVLVTGEAADMPKMSSFERRVIHLALSDYDDISTESFGEGRDRHVRVIPVSE
jgi:spoIIIJ-associated protein